MQILHLYFRTRIARNHVPAHRVWLEGTPGLIASVPLRQSSFPGFSLLFRSESDCEAFLMAGSEICRHSEVVLRRFSVPPRSTIERPLIIVGAPRSGTTLLYETLARCPELWTIGGESLSVIDRNQNSPPDRGNRLDETDARGELLHTIPALFLSILRDHLGQLYLEKDSDSRPPRIRLLEKTPRNSLRIPFLRKIFEDCLFVFLYRDPGPNIGSLIDGWNSDRFKQPYKRDFVWKFLFPPDWRSLLGRPVAEIAASQWHCANRFILDDLANIPRNDWHLTRYEDLIESPAETITAIWKFASLALDQLPSSQLSIPLPFSTSTLTAPARDKWLRHYAELQKLLPGLETMEEEVSAASLRSI
jgi:hypothetical protein